MKLLILAALTEATGNAVTARRLAEHLGTVHEVSLCDVNTITVPNLRDLARERQINVAIGVHALLAGPFLRALGIPYVLIFGGTDLYEQADELHRAQMARAVAGAARLIAFSPENRARAEWLWPSVEGRVDLFPQAVEPLVPEAGFSLRAHLGLAASDVLAVLPTGIRRVKDPLHVVDALSVWHVVHPRVHLAVVGAPLEADYVDDALWVLGDWPGVHYVPALPRARMLAAIRDADVVFNTSLSEGMCGVLLEAMSLGTPVVARRNAGNESLVAHGHTGLLYDSPGELVHWTNALMASPDLRGRIASAATLVISSKHSSERERRSYLELVDEIAFMGRPSMLPPAVASPDELATVIPAAARLGLGEPICEALRSLTERIYGDVTLEHTMKALRGSLETAPPSVAIAELRRARLEHSLGRDMARTFYLMLALLQIPAAEARHAERRIDAAVTRETLGDLAEEASRLHAQTGAAGITLDSLEWAQRYLRGELLRLGVMQFDLRPFAGALRVFRHRATRRLEALSLDGRTLDLSTGTIGDTRARTYDLDVWEAALEPGSPVLEMWSPPDGLLSREAIVGSMRRAYEVFGRLAPETIAAGMCGDSWRLDPQLLAAYPPDLGLHAIQSVCFRYPSSLSEAKILRSLFGPEADRASIAALPRERLAPFQLGMAEFLGVSSARLHPRSGFILREEFELIAASV